MINLSINYIFSNLSYSFRIHLSDLIELISNEVICNLFYDGTWLITIYACHLAKIDLFKDNVICKSVKPCILWTEKLYNKKIT